MEDIHPIPFDSKFVQTSFGSHQLNSRQSKHFNYSYFGSFMSSGERRANKVNDIHKLKARIDYLEKENRLLLASGCKVADSINGN